MKMKPTNIEVKLNQKKDKFFSGEEIIEDIKNFIAEDNAYESDIYREITLGENIDDYSNQFNLDLLETDKIFHVDQIKRICVVYRLRFLNSRYFKDDLPYEVLQKTKHLQKEHQTTLSGFKILAPSKCFRLKNADDPLLFAPIGNGYYYLIHKWGNDLHPLRKIIMWPLRSLENFILVLFIVSLGLTFLFPKHLFSNNLTGPEFFLVVFFMFKWVGGLAIFYGFKKGKNFSPAVWKSNYFNA